MGDIHVCVFCNDRNTAMRKIQEIVSGAPSTTMCTSEGTSEVLGRIVSQQYMISATTPLLRVSWRSPGSKSRGDKFHFAYVERSLFGGKLYWENLMPYVFGGDASTVLFD